MSETLNKQEELSYAGCYGSIVTHEKVEQFVEDTFLTNNDETRKLDERFSLCIWGHPGLGKTAHVKQFAKKPVVWNGKQYPGYKVYDVPIAQFEEMGDLHGMPETHYLMTREGSDGENEEMWVADGEGIIASYEKNGWSVNTGVAPQTRYLPPDWVPTEEGPSILLLDDWNRASIRIIKGIMQLLQNYGMVSWKLPKGCNIVLTGNPDEQDYQVSSIDSAILTRIKSITLRDDAKEWAKWAAEENIDGRGISFAMNYPEMMRGDERTNPRTLTEFFRFLKHIPKFDQDTRPRVIMQAKGLLDESTVSQLILFFEKEMEDVVSPEDILGGSHKAFEHIKDLMTRDQRGVGENRLDIVSIVLERLLQYVIHKKAEPTADNVRNFQKFMEIDVLPADCVNSVLKRVANKVKEDKTIIPWLKGNKRLVDIVKSTMS